MGEEKKFETISYRVESAVATITFNRPELYNAMNKMMKGEIIKAIKMANKDSNIRAIILTGEGKAFSSGQDLNDRTVSAEHGPVDLGNTLATEWNPLVMALRQSKKITIGAINGVCAGAGLSVALNCDLIIARPKTKFVSGFAQIGLTPDAGSAHKMGRHLGQQRALEFFLLGAPLMAEELHAVGMINRVEENPLPVAQEWAQMITSLPPLAVEITKKNLLNSLDRDLDSCLSSEVAAQRFLGKSEDYQEGVKAFLEKRKPNFSGK